jgi:hypothetical protein
MPETLPSVSFRRNRRVFVCKESSQVGRAESGVPHGRTALTGVGKAPEHSHSLPGALTGGKVARSKVIVDTVVIVTVDIIESPAFHDDSRFQSNLA